MLFIKPMELVFILVSIPLKQMERLKTISKSNTKMMISCMYQQTKWI